MKATWFFLLFSISCSHYQEQAQLSTQFQGNQFRANSQVTEYTPEKFYFPLKKYRISRGFSPYSNSHFGVDFVAPLGTSVYASHNGKVIFAGQGFSGYGKLIIIEHPDGFASFYAHLSHISVKQGSIVHAKDLIGKVGRTGRARGVHLHFELKFDEKAVDPMLYLQ